MVKRRGETSAGSQHGGKAKRKRSKIQLDNLPMDILSSVLSRLPFKEAVRTCVLSTQWKHLWCWRNKLDFSYDSVMSKSDQTGYFSAHGRRINKQKFIKSVNATLRQHNGVGIEQFRLRYILLNEDGDYIDRWVKYAIESKAKELILDLSSTRSGPSIVPYDFPFQTINMKNDLQLRFLQLSFVSLRPPADITCLPGLTKLCLEYVSVTDEDAQYLLSKCNRLVYLHVSYCETLASLRTRHMNQLKHLHVESCPLLEAIELNHGITELYYRGPFMALVLSSSLELTKICIKLSDGHSALESVFNKLPNTLSRLEMLTLSGTEFERAYFPRKLFKFISLRYLILELAISRRPERTFDVLDLACLLEAAPFMEKFDLHS